MSEPTAKQGDRVVGVDAHVAMIPSPGGPVPKSAPGLYFQLMLADPDLGGPLQKFCDALDPKSFPNSSYEEPYLPWITDNDEMKERLRRAGLTTSRSGICTRSRSRWSIAVSLRLKS